MRTGPAMCQPLTTADVPHVSIVRADGGWHETDDRTFAEATSSSGEEIRGTPRSRARGPYNSIDPAFAYTSINKTLTTLMSEHRGLYPRYTWVSSRRRILRQRWASDG